MKILVIGGGGREHAIVWKLKQSAKNPEVFCAPGNGGIAKLATCVPIKVTQMQELLDFAKQEKIDMVVVGPDDPLMMGMVDLFEENGFKTFGPRKNAAIIEGSKVFAKDLMKKYNIPTANYEVFDNSNLALSYINEQNTYPIVIKAEGLALGKGVIIAQNFEEAKAAISDIMEDKVFGAAGSRVVIEEFLTGQEISILAFTDGKTVAPMVSSQDHKKAFDGDLGPNTGGMGTFSPSRIYTDAIAKECMQQIFLPTVHAMQKENRPFKGVLYFGLILTQNGVRVIEYNARFGDPETQVVLPRLKTDLVDVFSAVIDETLDSIQIEWEDSVCVCVVMASGGYPAKYETGKEITGLDSFDHSDDIIVFHAGTKLENEKYYTAGGRVLGVTAVANSFDAAIQKSYDTVSKIDFEKAQYRKDIGIK